MRKRGKSVCVCVRGRERGVPEDADYVLKLQLMGKWISVLGYSVERASHTAKRNKPWQSYFTLYLDLSGLFARYTVGYIFLDE